MTKQPKDVRLEAKIRDFLDRKSEQYPSIFKGDDKINHRRENR